LTKQCGNEKLIIVFLFKITIIRLFFELALFTDREGMTK